MMRILSCGCADRPEVQIIYGGEDCDAVDGFVPCLFFSTYCQECADKLRAEGIPMFDSEEEGDRWLDEQCKDRPPPAWTRGE